MWICFDDMEYALQVMELNKTQKDEGKNPLTSYRYKVGFYKPNGDFEKWDNFERIDEAEAKVHYLNGGARG